MRYATLVGVLAVLGTAGCGGEAVAGGQREVTVDATGDGSSAAPARAPTGGARASVARDGSVQGTVRFTGAARVVVGGTAVPVGGSAATVEVRASGGDTVRLARGRVPAASFAAARIVFYEVEAAVTGGLIVGGVPVTGAFRVEIPAGDSLVVERAVAVPGGTGPVRLLVDLNTSTWLALANPATRTVPASALQAAVQVRVR